jgi:hypothetical protein
VTRVSWKASLIMTDPLAQQPRPVSLITIVAILALFAVVFVVVRRYYHPTTVSAFNAPAENLPKDLAWKASHETRRATLSDLREAQAKQGSSYAWVDQKAGVVQLPIERAMELTAQQYGKK